MKSRHTARRIALAVAVVLAAFVAVLATRSSGEKLARSPLLGRVAPSFQGASLLDGSVVSLDALRSQEKFVLLNFFGATCVPCRLEHPDLVKIANDHPNDLRLVSVVFEGYNVDDAREFFRSTKATWPLIESPRVAVDYGVAKIPETFLIDPDGVVISKATGQIRASRFEKVFAEALAERAARSR